MSTMQSRTPAVTEPETRIVASVRTLEQELITLFRQGRRASVELARQVDPELPLAAFGVLRWLATHPDARSADVAGGLGMDKGAVSRQIHQLEALGLVERTSDPRDKRAQTVIVTSLGSSRMAALQDASRSWLQQRLAGWGSEEIESFADVVRRYNESTAL